MEKQETKTWSLDDAREDFVSDVYDTLDSLKRKEWPHKPCINYEEDCDSWAGCPCVYYKQESEV